MAIVKMNEFSLLAFVQDKERLLKEMQKFGGLQFRDLDGADLTFLKKDSIKEQVSHYEGELSKVKFAIEKIKPYVEKPKGMEGLTTPKKQISYKEFDEYVEKYDYNSVYQTIKEQDEKLKAVKAEYGRLKSENENLRGWSQLDISPKQIDKLKSVKYAVGVVARTMVDGFRETLAGKFDECYVEMLNNTTDGQLALIIAPTDIFTQVNSLLKDLGFSRTTVNFDNPPGEIVKQNEKRMQELSVEEVSGNQIFKSMAGEMQPLNIALDYFQTCLERARAGEYFLSSQNVVLIEGWFPADESSKVEGIIKNVCGENYYLDIQAVEKDSTEVPIKLKNGKFASAFEDITAMYSMPRYNELDPTPVLAPFYFMSFGIMVGDFGYGLLLLIATSVALRFFHLPKGTKNFLSFLFWLSFAVMLAGILFGSCFGFPFFTPIATADGGRKAILDSQLDIVTMIILSIVVGVVQILFGLGVKGYMLIRDGHVLDAVFDSLLWILTIISSVGLLLGKVGVLSPELGDIAWYGFLACIAGLALTQGRTSPSLGGKIGSGLYAVYGLSSYVGDFVSYTRLVALSLSGAYIAYSFNLMAGLMPNLPLKIIGGGIIILLGQSLNLGLAVLGAYVHSCRLQYVEYFGKFYEGGGKPFIPFEMQNKSVDITK